jgi:pantoate--beta-alanine ligase
MAFALPTVRTVADLRAHIGGWRAEGLRVGLVPTMGALHQGHLSLVTRALQLADRVCVTLFVNPKQFGPGEDYSVYPRTEAADAALLAGAGAHLLYAPGVEVMYPEGFATTVTVSGVSEGLCGDVRPGHFQGVATVVAKLLLQAQPDVAVFGEKDYQQLQVIKTLVRDLDIPVEVVGAPTLRDPDGLAMSSRNAYLTPGQRAVAPALNRALGEAARSVANGAPASEATAKARADLLAAGFDKVDYVEVRDAETLKPVEHPTRPARVIAAAWLGKARLIDNVAVLPR